MGLEYPSVRTIEIDLQQIEKIREKMPIIEHRRRDLYSLKSPLNIIGIKIPFFSIKENLS